MNLINIYITKMFYVGLVTLGEMEDYLKVFRLEDWMDLPVEGGTDVISPPRVTNIPRPVVALKINVEEEEPIIPEAS